MQNTKSDFLRLCFGCMSVSLLTMLVAHANGARDSQEIRQDAAKPGRIMKRSEAGDRFQAMFGDPARLSDSALGRVVRFLEGIDEGFQSMTEEEIARELKDPFAVLLLRQGSFPGTLSELLMKLDAKNGDALGVPDQKSFLIGEGGRISFLPETAGLDRSFRYVVARSRAAEANVLVSTPAPAPDRTFLQVISWDPDNKVFNFYERLLGPRWAWRGSSRQALDSKTAQKGCFMCHVGGWPVMKELKQPWVNWHSMNSSIRDAVPDGSPLGSDPLFRNRRGAEDLELLVVRPNISRGLMAQEGRLTDAAGMVHGLPGLLRPLFETSTVNLTTSRQESAVNNDKFLPLAFFLNAGVLFDRIGLNPPDDFQNPRIAAAFYREAIRRFEFRLESGDFRQAGDTFFSFLVPEPSFEDVGATASLIRSGVITSRFAATVLAVDFANPVFSARRKRLSRYVPESVAVQGGQGDLPNRVAKAIRDASPTLPPDSPEREFLALWDLPEATWRQELERRIAAYLTALTTRINSQKGVNEYFMLAESRRREFSRLPLREPFEFMLPATNIPQAASLLQMRTDGTVGPK